MLGNLEKFMQDALNCLQWSRRTRLLLATPVKAMPGRKGLVTGGFQWLGRRKQCTMAVSFSSARENEPWKRQCLQLNLLSAMHLTDNQDSKNRLRDAKRLRVQCSCRGILLGGPHVPVTPPLQALTPLVWSTRAHTTYPPKCMHACTHTVTQFK